MKKSVKKYVIGTVAVVGVVGFTSGIYTAYINELTKEVSAAEVEALGVVANFDDSKATAIITLEGSSATGIGKGYVINEGVVNITASGTYVLRGEGEELQVYIDANDADVTIVLDNVTLSNSNDAPIFVKKAGTMKIFLPEGSVNFLSDVASDQELTDLNEREGNAVIYSKEDLTIDGTGTLHINGNYKNGITSKDNLFINNGNFILTAVNNGIIGKDSLTILDGVFTLEVGNDGLQSDNTDVELGFIKIVDGDFDIISEHDGIQAENLLQIDNGTFNITTNEGYKNAPVQTGQEFGGGMGGKGFANMDITAMPDFNIITMRETLKALDSETLEALGLINIDSLSDMELETVLKNFDQTQMEMLMRTSRGIMGKDTRGKQFNPTVEGEMAPEAIGNMAPPTMGNGQGEVTQPTNDADTTEEVTTKDSYKALKAKDIVINNGTFNIDSYDDAIKSDSTLTINGGIFKIASGNDGIQSENILTINSGDIDITNCYEGLEAVGVIINDGVLNIKSSDDGINAAISDTILTIDAEATPYIIINDGYIYTNSTGDGLDSNGTIDINGGEIYVDGPAVGPDLSVDFDNDAYINDGVLIAVGTSSMVHSFNDTSTQNSFIYFFTENQPAGSTITLLDKEGNAIFEYIALKEYSSLIASTPFLVAGETYTLSNGTTTEEITLSASSTTTTFGTSIEMQGGGRGFGGVGNKGANTNFEAIDRRAQ